MLGQHMDPVQRLDSFYSFPLNNLLSTHQFGRRPTSPFS